MINKADDSQNANPAPAVSANERTVIESGLQNLAAAAIAEDWMEKVRARNGERTVSANELASLSALVAYVAHVSGASEFRIERELADRFSVANVKCLPATRFDEAICHLVDQVPLDIVAA